MSAEDHTSPPPSPQRRRALDRAIRPTRAEIDLAALKANFAEARKAAGDAEVLAVVKANAYGHGATLVARALEEAGARFLAVALVEEGVELRNAGVKAPILVLGGSYEGGYDALVRYRLIPTVFRREHLIGYAAAARAADEEDVAVHLKIDTGMGRIGVRLEELEPFLVLAQELPHVRIDGLLSHFANADLSDAALTKLQIDRFREAWRLLQRHGHRPAWRHLSNSAAVMTLPELREEGLINMVRPGLMLYGLPPAEWLGGRAKLSPVMAWKTAITHVKDVEPGTPISYGSTWTAPRRSRIATLPVGYADGYDRAYSNKGHVLVRGQRAPIVGRVCMDMCMIDVTDVPGADVGDEIVLMGKQGAAELPVEELAKLSETITYEVLCGVGARVPRRAV